MSGEAFGYAIGLIIGVILVVALVGGAITGLLFALAKLGIAYEGLRRRRADARVERFLAEREATAAARPVRRIGEGA